MKKFEFTALLRSFLLFFTSMSILLGSVFFLQYKKDLSSFEELIFSEMKICSFNLQCDNFNYTFAPLENEKLYKLHKENEMLSSYFTIPGSQKNALKISISKTAYEKEVLQLRNSLFMQYLFMLAAVAVLSFIFALYTLAPLRNALKLTEEFVKDILHDFNTPLTTLRLNTSMLQKEFGDSAKLTRIENAVQNILHLQDNLRSCLKNHAGQNEELDLKTLINERVSLLQSTYPDICFTNSVSQHSIYTHKDSFTRIIDNILSNAAKYNKQNGQVFIEFEHPFLNIKDTGKGIKNPQRVFERFYKEQDRGLGIGLHIVKKLCDELGISIKLSSDQTNGSTFTLDLGKILN